MYPHVLDTFVSVVRDNDVAQAAICAVFLFILLDIIYGLGSALVRHEYSSTKMREGIGHKCSEIGFVLVGWLVDATIAAGLDLGFTAPVLVSICVYICLMEIGSLLEIFAKMNPQLANSIPLRLLESSKKLMEGKEDGEQ